MLDQATQQEVASNRTLIDRQGSNILAETDSNPWKKLYVILVYNMSQPQLTPLCLSLCIESITLIHSAGIKDNYIFCLMLLFIDSLQTFDGTAKKTKTLIVGNSLLSIHYKHISPATSWHILVSGRAGFRTRVVAELFLSFLSLLSDLDRDQDQPTCTNNTYMFNINNNNTHAN